MSTPARTASSYKSGRMCRQHTFFARFGIRAARLAACSAVLVAGCNQVGSGLNSNLPPAGGGGLLSFASVAMPDGISGRAYSKVAVTSVETKSKTNFPISPATASGTAPLASCTVSAGTLPPGMNAALTVDSTGAGCVISGTPSAAAAGNTYQFTIQALDSNSPPRAAAQTFTMKVRPEFTVTAPAAVVGNVLPAGVQGRTYGQIAANAAAMTAGTNLSATSGNGAVGAKNYCALSVTPALATLTLTQVAGTNNCQLQGNAALAAAGSYKVTVSLTDNPIVDPETNLQAVPANTIAAASNATLNVAAPLKIVAQADAVSATPPAAVQGRAYGTGSGCSGGSCLPLTYVSSGGLPSVEAADSYLFSSSAALTAAGINCAASASSTVAKTTCSGTAGAAGTANYSVTVDDAGNLATPGGSASATTASVSGLSLTVDSALNLAVSPDPAANPAVQSRAYGTGTGCSGAGAACVAPTYTPSGGLGTYSFNISGSAPSGITCAANGGNTAVVCSGTAGSTATTSTFGVAASDVANASTPSATTATVSKTLTVNGALTLTPPASLQPAVNGRAFGTGAGCSGGNCVPAVFTISGGLGTYSASAAVVSAPGTWNCPLAGSNYNCSSAAVVSGTPNLSITASDGANATTPGATTASAIVAVTVNPALAITPPAAVPDAVTGRAYGTTSTCTGGSCVPLQYVVTGGLGTYGAGALTAGSNTFNCAGTGTYLCSIGTMSGSGTQTLSMTVSDVGNASTPAAPVNDASKSINILSKVTLANANLGTTWPNAVQGRAYAGTGFTSDQFAVANGIGPYTFLAPSGFPTGFTCTPAATTDTCSATIVGTAGNYNPQITVQDTGNASTPKSTVVTDPASQLTASLTVKSPLSVTPPNLGALPAVNGRPFGTGSGCSSGNCQPAVFQVTGGLGTYAAAATVASAPGIWTCTLSGTNYNCSSASVGAAPAGVMIDVVDIANATTPAATVATDPASQSTAALTIDPQITLTAPVGLAIAVNGRVYGRGTGCTGGGGNCQPAAFVVTGGLGTYSAAATVTAAPGGVTGTWTCAFTSPNYNCSSSSVGGSGASTLTVVGSDVANASTPAATLVTDPASQATANLTVGDPLQLTPPVSIPDGVTNREYGTGTGCLPGPACAPLTYTAANGISPYSFTLSGFPTGIGCSQSSATYSCSAVSVTGAANTYNPQVGVTDSANASTPASSPVNSPAATLVVRAQLSLGPVNPDPATNPAVQGRVYGSGLGCSAGACQAPTFTPSGGLGNYTVTAPSSGAPPAGITCTTPNQGTSSAVASCSGTPTAAGGPTSFSVSVIDTANASTPAAASASVVSTSLTVNGPLAVGASALPNALVGYPYPTVNGAATPAAPSGGLPAYTWVEPGTSGCTGAAPPGWMSLNAVTGALSGTLPTPSGSFAFSTCVTDTPNLTTPLGALPINLSMDVIDTLAYAAEPNSNQVEVINTTSNTVVGSAISTGPGSIPVSVALSPSGRFAFVTLPGTGKLAVIDTLSNAQITNSPISLTGCTAAQGVAATATRIFIACSGSDSVDVLDDSSLSSSAPDASVITALPSISTGSTTGPESVAIRPDGQRVYVTLTSTNQLFVIDNSVGTPVKLAVSGNPFSLQSTVGTVPFGIVVVPNISDGTLAYIGKQAGTSANDGVEVVSGLDTDSFSTLTSITVSAATASPQYVAATPDNARVYVSLTAANQFAIIDNTVATPTLGPLVSFGPGTAPEQLTIPPLSSGTLRIYVSLSGTNGAGVIDNSSTPSLDTSSPISLASGPNGIASIPAPK